MIKCEETFCENIQLAICLHCMHRLCIYHIEEHQTILVDDVNELKNQVNEVNIILTNALNMIGEERKAEENKCNDWRQRKLNDIERQYNRKTSFIEDRQKKLEKLELKLNRRLKVEVQKPLEDMCIHKSINVDLIKSIQLAIETIKQDSTYLTWNFEKLNNINNSNSSKKDKKERISSTLPKEKQKMRKWQPRNDLFTLFRDVGRTSIDRINDFVQTMEDEDKIDNNGLITLTFSYLQTWYQTKRDQHKKLILNKHILTIKKYVIGKDYERKVLIAMEFFFNKLQYKRQLEIEMMTMLLQLFFEYQCISISEIIDWYSNDHSIDKILRKNVGKKWAKPFMNQHGCHIQSIILPSTETTNNSLNSSQTSLINIQINSNVKYVHIRKPYNNLVALFKQQSTKNDRSIHDYIKMQYVKEIDYRVIMIVRCYLKAWNECVLEKKNDLLLGNLCIIEYYKSDQDFEMQILFAIEIFLSQNKKNDNWSSKYHLSNMNLIYENLLVETISILFQLFFDHNLIKKETFLKWNFDGHFYNEIYYEHTKRFAQSFIQQLITSEIEL